MDFAAGATTDLLAPFTRYAEAVGTTVYPVASRREAAIAILSLAQGTLQCSAAVRDGYPDLYELLLTAGPVPVGEEVLAAAGPRATGAVLLSGGTGLIVAHAGIAETGTLIFADDGLAPRILGMLPDLCIALLPASTLLPTLDEAGALLGQLEAAGHRYLAFVTGPSRSADIEMNITVGVHGPKALAILVLEDE